MYAKLDDEELYYIRVLCPLYRSILLAAVRGWMDERETGAEELTVLPGDVVKHGVDAIRTYFADKRADKLLRELQGARHQAANVNEQIGKLDTKLDAKLDHLENYMDSNTRAMMTLATAEGNLRDYPSLWTLEYRRDGPMLTSTFVLKIRSHLSGKCFHEPIEITVPNKLFGDYGVVIKVRMPDILTKVGWLPMKW